MAATGATRATGRSSTQANPVHTYTQAGIYTARLTVSDGVTSTISTPVTISAGNAPVATILSPADGATFRAGDVISYSGDATDVEDGVLPASSFTWKIDFLHEGHVHPGIPVTGVKSGSFTIGTTGHDFSGNTRYRIALTVTDSNGLSSTRSIIVTPQKVNLTFNSVPSGLTLYLDGIAHTTPFVYDTLIGFNHTIEARNQSAGATAYTFASWSDSGAQVHSVLVPSTPQTYTATYTQSQTPPVGNAWTLVQSATTIGQTLTFGAPVTAGNLVVVLAKWEGTAVISTVSNSGDTYTLGTAKTHSGGEPISQQCYVLASTGGSAVCSLSFASGTPTYVRMIGYEFSATGTHALDAQATPGSGTGTSLASGTASSSVATGLAIGGYAEYTFAALSNVQIGGTAVTATTQVSNSTGAAYLTFTSAISTGAFTATTPNNRWNGHLMLFKSQ